MQKKTLPTIVLTLLIGIVIGAGTFYLLTKRTDPATAFFSTLENFDKEGEEIGIDDAVAMVNKYQEETSRRTGSEGSDLPLVKSVHFEYGPLGKFILKSFKRNATGMRIYFGTYYKSTPRTIKLEDGRDTTIDLKGYNTVVLVPTKKDKTGEIRDIILPDDKYELLKTIYQPFNGGISCPPYPPKICNGQGL